MNDEQDHWFSRRGLEREKAAGEGLFRRYREVREGFERDRSSVQGLHSDNMLRGEARAHLPVLGREIAAVDSRRWLRDRSDHFWFDAAVSGKRLRRDRGLRRRRGVGVAAKRKLYVFHDMIVDGDTRLERRFDLILFQEFYPLTRTADWSVHLSFLTFALRHLEDGGDIFIQLALRHPDETVLHNMGRLTAFCSDHRLILKQREIPFDRLVDWLRFPAVAGLLTGLAARMFRADRRCVLHLHAAAGAVG